MQGSDMIGLTFKRIVWTTDLSRDSWEKRSEWKQEYQSVSSSNNQDEKQ